MIASEDLQKGKLKPRWRRAWFRLLSFGESESRQTGARWRALLL